VVKHNTDHRKTSPYPSPNESFGQEGDMHSDLYYCAIKNTYHYLLGVNRRLVSPASGGIKGGGNGKLKIIINIPPPTPSERGTCTATSTTVI
jgi:hypothetical protein